MFVCAFLKWKSVSPCAHGGDGGLGLRASRLVYLDDDRYDDESFKRVLCTCINYVRTNRSTVSWRDRVRVQMYFRTSIIAHARGRVWYFLSFFFYCPERWGTGARPSCRNARKSKPARSVPYPYNTQKTLCAIHYYRYYLPGHYRIIPDSQPRVSRFFSACEYKYIVRDCESAAPSWYYYNENIIKLAAVSGASRRCSDAK